MASRPPAASASPAAGSPMALMRAGRPWSLPVSLSPVLVGAALAYRSSPKAFSFPAFILTLLGGLSVHLFGNLVNTLGDFESGLDRKENPTADRALVDGSVSSSQVRSLAIGCLLTGAVCMVLLLRHIALLPAHASSLLGLSPVHSFIVLVSCGVFVAYAYTGWPLRLKYHRLGDACILVAFGPLLVLGASFVHTGVLAPRAGLYSVPLGLLTEAVLHANNARDIKVDLAAGARTLANSVSFATSLRIFQALYAVAFFCLPLFALLEGTPALLLPAAMLTQVSPLVSAFRAFDHEVISAKKHDGDSTAEADAATRRAAKASALNLAASDSGTSPSSSSTSVDLCDRCGQFSFGFGALLAIALLIA